MALHERKQHLYVVYYGFINEANFLLTEINIFEGFEKWVA